MTSPSQSSDWFRSAVLFWKGKSGSDENLNQKFRLTRSQSVTPATGRRKSGKPTDLDSCIAAKNKCKKSADAKKSESVRVVSDVVRDVKGDDVTTTSEILKIVAKKKIPNTPRKNPPANVAKKTSDTCETAVGSKEATINTRSVLLKQVEDLEEFVNSSPHLTLEFPKGSAINENPLFTKGGKKTIAEHSWSNESEKIIVDKTKALKNTNGFKELVEEKPIVREMVVQNNFEKPIIPEKSKTTPVSGMERPKEGLSVIHGERIPSIERSSTVIVNSNKQNEQRESGEEKQANSQIQSHENIYDNIANLNNIKKVQDTLRQISQQIYLSHNDMMMHDEIRDPDETMNDWLSNIHPPEHDADSLSSKRTSVLSKSEFLLNQIDELINFDVEGLDSHPNKPEKFPIEPPRDRLDSGLQSITTSAPTSPFPSPQCPRSSDDKNDYDSGFCENRPRGKPKGGQEEESSSSDNWSPGSTLESLRNTLERKTHAQSTQQYATSDTRDIRTMVCKEEERRYEQTELKALKKFVNMADHLKHKHEADFTNLSKGDKASTIPGMQSAIEIQRRELLQQRSKQESFLTQLGELLLEIVNLKDEQSIVRAKQAKALTLMKKQLDIHKKAQTQAHHEVLNQVQTIHEKLNTSLTNKELCDTNEVRPYALPPVAVHLQTYGETIWKISDVTKKLARVKSGECDGTLVSAPFHTTQFGYKMNGWLYLNGRGKAAGSFVSLYVCVLVGDYDAILPWPFKPTYKFTLIDQQGDTTKRVDHVKVRRVLDIAGRGENIIAQIGGIPRPCTSSKALIVGFDDFVSHEALNDRSYMVDDTLFIKIEVDVEN